MIVLTRLSGAEFALNCDLIEKVESTPDTIITLVDSKKYIVKEPLSEVVAMVNAYRSAILADSVRLGAQDADQHAALAATPGTSAAPAEVRHLSAVPGAAEPDQPQQPEEHN